MSNSNNEVTKMFLTASSVKQFKSGDVVVISKTKYAALKDNPATLRAGDAVSVPSSVEDASAASRYGTQDYRAVRKLRAHSLERMTKAQNSIAKEGAVLANSEVAPSFNTKTIEDPQTPQEQSLDSLDSQQDRLNAIAVAMRAAGMSGLEIAQALKEEMSLV